MTHYSQQEHIDALDATFDECLDRFNQRQIFTGPSIHFYRRVVDLVRAAPNLTALARNEQLAELAYAALMSWGMHRMGETVAAKLTEYADFREAVWRFVAGASVLEGHRITTLAEGDLQAVMEPLAGLLETKGVTASGSPLVANAKLLHFLLPDLMPPIDRAYTGRFFYGPNRGRQLPGGARKVFTDVFPRFCWLARRHAQSIRSASGDGYLCLGEAKVLDNAIVGYMLRGKN